MKKCTSKDIFPIVIQTLLVLSTIIGLYDTLHGSDFMSGSKTLLYYTIQSNLWIAGICVVFIVIEVKRILTGKNDISNTLLILKFIFTAAITLTFMVFSVLLTPLVSVDYLLSPSNLFLHNATPILAILDFILFDGPMKTKKWHFLLPSIMPLYYLLFSLLIGALGITFTSTGDRFPYFFLNYEKLGWFRIRDAGFGVFYWIMIMFLFMIVIGWLFLRIKEKKITKNKKSSATAIQ